MSNRVRTNKSLKSLASAFVTAAVALSVAASGTLVVSSTQIAIASADEVSVALEVSFSDTPASAWYMKDGWINYVVSKGLMTGYNSNRFGPDDALTREQAVTILYRYANPNSTATTKESDFGIMTPFVDVYLQQYSTAAIDWAYETGIVKGYYDAAGNWRGLFGPRDTISREQLATIIYRFAGAGSAGTTSGVSRASDWSSVSGYARDAMTWCYNKGIITGDGRTGMLMPQSPVTRAQMAKIITVLSRDVL